MTEPTRDIGIGIMAAVVTLLSLAGALWALASGGWWLLTLTLLLPLAAVCGYGTYDSLTLAERDEHGNKTSGRMSA